MRTVFREVVCLIHSTLTGQYGVSDAEARAIESDLEQWFVRFCRRNPDGGPRAHVVALFSLACSFGASQQPPPALPRGFEDDADDEPDPLRFWGAAPPPAPAARPPRPWARLRKLFSK